MKKLYLFVAALLFAVQAMSLTGTVDQFVINEQGTGDITVYLTNATGGGSCNFSGFGYAVFQPSAPGNDTDTMKMILASLSTSIALGKKVILNRPVGSTCSDFNSITFINIEQ